VGRAGKLLFLTFGICIRINGVEAATCVDDLAKISYATLELSAEPAILDKQLRYLLLERHQILIGKRYTELVRGALLSQIGGYVSRLKRSRNGGPSVTVDIDHVNSIWRALSSFYQDYSTDYMRVTWETYHDARWSETPPFEEFRLRCELVSRIVDNPIANRLVQRIIGESLLEFLPAIRTRERIEKWREGLRTNQMIGNISPDEDGWMVWSSILKTVFSAGIWAPLKFGARAVYEVNLASHESRYRRNILKKLTPRDQNVLSEASQLGEPLSEMQKIVLAKQNTEVEPFKKSTQAAVNSPYKVLNDLQTSIFSVSYDFYEVSRESAKQMNLDELESEYKHLIATTSSADSIRALNEKIHATSEFLMQSLQAFTEIREKLVAITAQLKKYESGTHILPTSEFEREAHLRMAQATATTAATVASLAQSVMLAIKQQQQQFGALQTMSSGLSTLFINRAFSFEQVELKEGK
jgi:hypothetical protein